MVAESCGVLIKIVHRRLIKTHFSSELRLEIDDFQVNDHVAVEPGVIEQQIEKKFVPIDFEPILVPDEGKARAHLDKEIPKDGPLVRFRERVRSQIHRAAPV